MLSVAPTNHFSQCVSSSITPMASCILTSLEVLRATGRFKSRARQMLSARKAYLPLSLSWSCTSASLKPTGVSCLFHSNSQICAHRKDWIMHNPVVFIHGSGDSARVWCLQLDYFGTDRAFAIDL